MTDPNQNYIYAYDDEARQIIVINAETGKRIEEKNNHVCSILAYLNSQGERKKLRKFAIWCAYLTNQRIKPMQRRFLELGEQAVQGDADLNELEKKYTQSEREAIAIDTIGLRQGSEEAPGFLITRECINPDAFEGAKNAARFHCLWAGFQHEEDNLPPFLSELSPVASQNTIEETEKKQVNYLLDLISA